MQLEKAQYTAKAGITGVFGLLSRFIVVLLAATGSLTPPASVRAQQPANDPGVSGLSRLLRGRGTFSRRIFVTSFAHPMISP